MNLLVPFTGAVVTVALWLVLAKSPTLFDLPALNLSAGWRWGGAVVFFLDAAITLFWSLAILTASQRSGSLALTGPYAYLRHPIYGALLYSGTAGMAFAFSAWPVLLAVIPLSVMWTLIANREEEALLKAFGSDYGVYMQQTGQLFPRLSNLLRQKENDLNGPSA